MCVSCQPQNTHNSNISHKLLSIPLQNAPRMCSVDPYTIYINACLPVGQTAVHTSNPVVLTRHFTLPPSPIQTASKCSSLPLYCLPYIPQCYKPPLSVPPFPCIAFPTSPSATTASKCSSLPLYCLPYITQCYNLL